jgi:hypothetical protein
MEHVSLMLERSEAEALMKCIKRRDQTICDIKQELCSAGSGDKFEQEQFAFFAAEEETVERILAELNAALSGAPR